MTKYHRPRKTRHPRIKRFRKKATRVTGLSGFTKGFLLGIPAIAAAKLLADALGAELVINIRTRNPFEGL